MVNIEDIENVFSGIIDNVESVKCSQKLTLQNTLATSMDEFALKVRGKPTETAVFMSDDGRILDSKDGSEKEVEFTKTFFKQMFKANGNQPYNIDHNHPNPYGSLFPVGLSYPDFERLMDSDKKLGFLCKSMNVEDGFNGSKMGIIRGDDFKPEDKDKFLKLAHDFEDTMVSMIDDFHEKRNKTMEAWLGDYGVGDLEDMKLVMNLQMRASNKALSSINYDDVLRDYKEKFREINCNLQFERLPLKDVNSDEFYSLLNEILVEDGLIEQ